MRWRQAKEAKRLDLPVHPTIRSTSAMSARRSACSLGASAARLRLSTTAGRSTPVTRRSSTPATPATPATPSNGHTPAANAFDNFRNSTNYQFRFGQGLDALDKGAAEKGSLDSGAARKAEMEYGQNFASNELSTYMDRLYQQETLGMSASSALAGVGQNLVGQVSANNNNGAAAAGNAALASGAATANMWNGVANSVGNAGGMILGGMNRSSIGPSALSGMNFANSPVNLSGPGLFY
jgi:hypothetical protein